MTFISHEEAKDLPELRLPKYAAILEKDQEVEDEEIQQFDIEREVEESLYNKAVEWGEAQSDFERGN